MGQGWTAWGRPSRPCSQSRPAPRGGMPERPGPRAGRAPGPLPLAPLMPAAPYPIYTQDLITGSKLAPPAQPMLLGRDPLSRGPPPQPLPSWQKPSSSTEPFPAGGPEPLPQSSPSPGKPTHFLLPLCWAPSRVRQGWGSRAPDLPGHLDVTRDQPPTQAWGPVLGGGPLPPSSWKKDCSTDRRGGGYREIELTRKRD